ncbi:MAG: mandelate racemase/muconate lactonizing enzyme family protein [bacterium]
MKIVDVRTVCLSRIHEREEQWITARYRSVKADCAVVVITTDEGLTGIGEASAYGWPLVIRRWVEWLEPTLTGVDPRDRSIVPTPTGRDRGYDAAAAGIDCALWDLRGQVEGKPIAAMLNAAAAGSVRVYASSGCRYDWDDRPEQLIEEVLGYADAGWSACKVRMGTEWRWSGVTVDRFLGHMRDLAGAVDGRIELMLDGNQRLTEDEALPIARELDRLGFAWFEEPIPQDDVEGYARLNRAVDMPITGGEQFATLDRFREYLERGAYAIVQPDAGIAGITQTFRIAEAAHRHGVDFCPHSWHNGLMCTANAHLVAASPNPRVLEVCMVQGPLQWAILAEPPTIRDGRLELPDSAGMGVRLAEALEERFPYVEGHYAVTVER